MADREFYSLLSEGEREALRGIEARLAGSDPRLARRLSRLRPPLAFTAAVLSACILALGGGLLAVTARSTSVMWGCAGLLLIAVSFSVCLFFGIRRGV
jgi:hypothetical protein